ncbi:MAG: NUDIX domain-containing protein, partial [candidate division Zixibacteria bacterium]|nr:NUDIX domain-containing protein [candidate division Zixibacteria bacterium]
ERIFKGKVFAVRIDQVEKSSGEMMRIDIVEHDGAVVLIPVDDEGRIWFVQQYRHPTGKWLLELPAGTLGPEEEPKACAVRECREEIGMSPGQLIPLGGTFLAPGYSTEYLHFYLAKNLHPAPLTPDHDENLKIERLTWDEASDRVIRGELEDTKSLAGLFMARNLLNDRSAK